MRVKKRWFEKDGGGEKNEIFISDTFYASSAILGSNIDKISQQMIDGVSVDILLDEVIAEYNDTPLFGFDEMHRNIIHYDDRSPVQLFGPIENGGMGYDDMIFTLQKHSFKALKGSVNDCLYETLKKNPINDDKSQMEYDIGSAMAQQLPLKVHVNNEIEFRIKMLTTWLNLSIDNNFETAVGIFKKTIDKTPFEHFSYTGKVKEFVITDRDLSTYYPVYYGYDRLKVKKELESLLS